MIRPEQGADLDDVQELEGSGMQYADQAPALGDEDEAARPVESRFCLHWCPTLALLALQICTRTGLVPT